MNILMGSKGGLASPIKDAYVEVDGVARKVYKIYTIVGEGDKKKAALCYKEEKGVNPIHEAFILSPDFITKFISENEFTEEFYLSPTFDINIQKEDFMVENFVLSPTFTITMNKEEA